MKLYVKEASYEKALKFVELISGENFYTVKEILDEIDVNKKTLEKWLSNIAGAIEKKKIIKEYLIKTKTKKIVCTGIRATKKIEVINGYPDKQKVKNKRCECTAYRENLKIKEIIKDKKEIKKDNLIDLAIDAQYNASVKQLIEYVQSMGVRVIC